MITVHQGIGVLDSEIVHLIVRVKIDRHVDRYIPFPYTSLLQAMDYDTDELLSRSETIFRICWHTEGQNKLCVKPLSCGLRPF